MRKVKNFLLILLVLAVSSCATGGTTGKKGELGKKTGAESDQYIFQGTNTEIMNAFKSIMSRYQFDEFSMASLRIVTKPKKLDESSPYYEANRRGTDIYEQYTVIITREEYNALVDIRYSILVQQMDMKTNKIGYKEINRIKSAEEKLINKVKRLLYGA